MEKSKIDWCDSTWNPVTGCLHGCEYCYARGIAQRFGNIKIGNFNGNICELDEPYRRSSDRKINPYPYEFMPTFHRYRLNEYIEKKGRTIFVCSMADLFGKWVPDSWIEEVFNACEKAPQHNYLFLTKNPQRYEELSEKGILIHSKNMRYGWSETKNNPNGALAFSKPTNTFVSIEPILEPVCPSSDGWVIVGAETGRRKNKVIPKREWIEQLVEECKKYHIPLFMKSSLSELWGEPLIQEFPKGLKRSEIK